MSRWVDARHASLGVSDDGGSMNNDLRLAALTLRELLLFAPSEDSPFGKHPPSPHPLVRRACGKVEAQLACPASTP